VSFYVSTATFVLLHCDEWDRVVALPRHNFVTGATLLQLAQTGSGCIRFNDLKVENATFAEYSCPIRLLQEPVWARVWGFSSQALVSFKKYMALLFLTSR
jgi:hypothetical protein